ncbi:MAG: hypothetical protein ACI97A_001532, partial [Planctomycetota bacterium]
KMNQLTQKNCSDRPFSVLQLFCCLVLLLCGCRDGASEKSAAPQSGPIMHAENLDYDFGSVFTGVVKNAKFAFVNRGTTDLLIARATKDCGCTKPSFDKRRLAPGESGTMTVTLLAPFYHGQLTKRIRVFTNDPNNEITTFTLKMKGMGKASLTPEVIRFGDETVMPGSEAVYSFDLEMPIDQPILGVSMNAESPYVRARLAENSTPGKTKVELVFSGLREKVKFRDYLILNVATKNPAGKRINVQPQGIQVNGFLKPRISASRTMINLGVVRQGEERALALEIYSIDQVGIRNIRLVSSCETLKLLNSSTKDRTVLETILLDHSPGRLFATLHVLMTNGLSIEVPVLAWVEPRL